MPVTEQQLVQTLEIVKEEEIAAPIHVVFEEILAQLGPLNETPEGVSLAMKLEAWPGGRWFRDLGDGAGHWWGSVQAIKPPSLIEVSGPLFLSYPSNSNVQYRLKEENGVTQLKFTHRAVGWLPTEMSEGAKTGWSFMLEQIRKRSLARG